MVESAGGSCGDDGRDRGSPCGDRSVVGLLRPGGYFFTRTGREGMRIQRMEGAPAPEEDDAGGQPPPPTATVESLPPNHTRRPRS
jgi:hypothetical protein